MKRRNLLLNYILTIMTSGLFGIVWLFLMAFDVNRENANLVPRLPIFAVIYALLFIVYITLVGYNIYQIDTATLETWNMHEARLIPILPLFVVAIILLAYPIYLLRKVVDFIRQSGLTTHGNGVLVFLFFFYFLSIPILQNKINILCDKKT